MSEIAFVANVVFSTIIIFDFFFLIVLFHFTSKKKRLKNHWLYLLLRKYLNIWKSKGFIVMSTIKKIVILTAASLKLNFIDSQNLRS